MDIGRIQAVVLRHLLLTFRVLHRIADILYWPLLNIILWGFSSIWHEQLESPITFTVLTSLLFWQVLFRSNMEVCYSLLDELRSNNFSNLFSTPLMLGEWMIGVTLIGLLKSLFTFAYGAFCIWVLYSINVLTLGWELVPFTLLLILIGWSVGFLTASCIITWGQHVEGLMWLIVWAFVPLSGIFFPVAILPDWLQMIAYCLPQSYVFEGLRLFISTGSMPTMLLMKGFFLIIIYFSLSLLFFKNKFEKSKQRGFARLERYE